MYRLQSIGLLAGIISLFAFVGYMLFGWVGVVLILTGSLVFNLLTLGNSARVILSLHRARPLAHWQAPEIHRLAEQLAHRANIPVPQLAIFPSDMPNAFALGIKGGVVAFSTGLLNLLNQREIAGVLAHEFAHLKNRDSLLSLSAGLFVQAIAAVSSIVTMLVLVLFLTGAWVEASGNLFKLVLISSIAPQAAYLLQAALMRTREYLADRDGALLSGDPRGLANALYKLEQYNRYVSALQKRFRFIYTTESDRAPKWLRTHPPTEERIDALLEVATRTTPYPSRSAPPRQIAVM